MVVVAHDESVQNNNELTGVTLHSVQDILYEALNGKNAVSTTADVPLLTVKMNENKWVY